MPRSIRKISKTKVYHVILRVIYKQYIFLEEQDYNKLLRKFKRLKKNINMNCMHIT